jgi:anaerobic magnesium-protoporphyrin IX monomethyl ester cyclase
VKVCLINPPYLPLYSRAQRSPAVTRSGTLYYPLWLAHAGALLEAAQFLVTMIDAPARGLDEAATLDEASAGDPLLVVVDTSTPSIANDLRFVERVKDRLPHCFIAATGTHVTALPHEALEQCPALDAVVVGEYDETVRDLAVALEQGSDRMTVPGLALRDPDGVPVTTQTRQPIADLDGLPFVSVFYRRHLVPAHYFNPNSLYPMLTLITSRGCPHSCSFCLYPQTTMGRRLRTRSPENVVEELHYIKRHFPEVRGLFFEDDTFTLGSKRVAALCEAILAAGIDIPWTANARADVPADLLQLMKRAGCRQVCVGFESGAPASLAFIEKKLDTARMHRFVKDARKTGILVHGCFIVGFPGETPADMERTWRLAAALRPDTAQFYPVMVYPGTTAYEHYRSEGLLETEDYALWLDETGQHNCVISTGSVGGAELVAFCNRARRRFYLRPRYLMYKAWQTVTSPGEAVRNVKALKTFARYLFRG